MVFGLFRKKPAKKAVAKKAVVKKTAKPKKVTKKKVAIKKTAPPVASLEVIGKVTHYFPHVKAAVIKIKRPLVLGDNVHILGHTTNFKQAVTSMQINNVPIKEAKRKDEIGFLVKSRVRHGDTVYKL